MAKFVSILKYSTSDSRLVNDFSPLRDSIPAASGAEEWNLHKADRFVAADVDNDGLDELVVNKSDDRIGVIEHDAGSLKLLWTVDNRVGDWKLRGADEYLVGDFDGDGAEEIAIRKGGARIGLLKWMTDRLELVSLQEKWVERELRVYRDHWKLRGADKYVVARLESSQPDQLVARHKGKRVGIFSWNGTRFVLRWAENKWINEPGETGDQGWRMNGGDVYEVADLDGDLAEEIVVHKGDDRIGVLKWQDDRLVLLWNHDKIINWTTASPDMTPQEIYRWVLGRVRWPLGWPLKGADDYIVTKIDSPDQDRLVINKADDRIGLVGWEDGRLALWWRQNRWINQPGGSGDSGWRLRGRDEYYPGDFFGVDQAVVIRKGGAQIGVVDWQAGRLELTSLQEDEVEPEGSFWGWRLRGRDRYLPGHFLTAGETALFVYDPGSSRNLFEKIARGVKRVVNKAFDAVADVFKSLGNALGDALHWLGEQIPGVGVVFQWLGDIISSALDFVSSVIRGVGAIIGGVLGGVFKIISGIVTLDWDDIVGGLGDIFGGIFGGVILILGKAWALIQVVFTIGRPRRLNDAELALIELVFQDSIATYNVRVVDGFAGLYSVNDRAFVLGDTIYMKGDSAASNPALFVHECVHVWQNQHVGASYISEAIYTQNWGVHDDWRSEAGAGKDWIEFEREAQAEMIEAIYDFGSATGVPAGPGSFFAQSDPSLRTFIDVDLTALANQATETLRNPDPWRLSSIRD